MTSHKKPGVAFRATVVMVCLLVAYPLSFGPACWISSRTALGHRTIPKFYRPLTLALDCESFPALGKTVGWYSRIGAAEGWHWSYAIAPYWDAERQSVVGEFEWMWMEPVSGEAIP